MLFVVTLPGIIKQTWIGWLLLTTILTLEVYNIVIKDFKPLDRI